MRYFRPNKNRNYEVYVHHLLILFYRFRTESDLSSDNSYTNKLPAPDVIDNVNRNTSIIESSCELVDEAMLMNNTEINRSQDQEVNNDERIEENLFLNNGVADDDNIENEDVDCVNQSELTDFEITSALLLQNDEEISDSICSLNVKQRQIFYYILT